MVAISFSVFKEKLLSGEKDQTIRPYSECQFCKLKKARSGKYNLQIYWKLRTKEAEKLFDARCTDVFLIELDPLSKIADDGLRLRMTEEEFEELWRRDGFETEEQFWEFFEKKYGDLRNKLFMVIRFERIEE